MTSSALAPLVLAGSVATLGCSDASVHCRSVRCEDTLIHVATWWPREGGPGGVALESAARARPGVEVNWVDSGDRATHVRKMAAALGGGDRSILDAMLVNAGPDVLRWVGCGLGGVPSLLRLDEIYPDLRERFAEPVLRGVECEGGGVYAMPLGLHRINHVFYNQRRAEACTSTVEDAESLIGWLECLRSSGDRVIALPARGCLAQCSAPESDTCRDCEQELAGPPQFLLESLMLLEGAEAYESALSPPESLEPLEPNALGSAVRVLSEEFRARYVNNCAVGATVCDPPDLATAAEEVARGTAAVLVMPDWYDPGTGVSWAGDWAVDVTAAPFPGTEDVFLFTLDAFVAPAHPAEDAELRREASLRWLDVLLDPGAQSEFASLKRATAALTEARDGGESPTMTLVPSMEARLRSTAASESTRTSMLRWVREGRLDSETVRSIREATRTVLDSTSRSEGCVASAGAGCE